MRQVRNRPGYEGEASYLREYAQLFTKRALLTLWVKRAAGVDEGRGWREEFPNIDPHKLLDMIMEISDD